MSDLFNANHIKQTRLSKFTGEQLKQVPDNKAAQKELKRRNGIKPELPKLEEGTSLVEQILSEMGIECDFKKHKTAEEVASKHGKSLKYINSQLKAGIKVEKEHTTDPNEAEVIALQHLEERPDYYEKLQKVETVDEACWKTHEPDPEKPYKMKGGRRVRNCILKVNESYRLPAQNGQLMQIVHSWRGRPMSTQLFFPSGRVPSRSEVLDAINKVYPETKLLSYRTGDFSQDQPLITVGNSRSKNYLLNNKTIGESAAWTKKEGKPQAAA